MNLTRYRGHLSLPGVGPEGQERLKRASVLCIGTGGLGSPALLYLAAAGVGRIGLMDTDEVDESNLHRQILFKTRDVGESKVRVARERLNALNPEVELVMHPERLSAKNALAVLSRYDVIIDGTDNFPTRYLINDTCVRLGKPDVWASVFRFEGQVSVFDATKGPCYRCLFREIPPDEEIPSCAEAGVLGVLPGILGTTQALEAIKLLLGVGRPLIGRLMLFDGLELGWTELAIEKDPACPACSPEGRARAQAEGAMAAARPAVEVTGVAPQELLQQLEQDPNALVIDCREPYEWDICHLEGSRLVPLGQLPSRLHELAGDRPVVVLCHHGPRSRRAAALLSQAGLKDVRFLEGGLHAWALEVDPTMARY